MSEKESTSVSLKKEHLARMDEDNVNRSALINELLDEYYDNGGKAAAAVSEYRIESLNFKEKERKAELEAIRQEKARLKAKAQSQEKTDAEKLSDAVDALVGVELSASNPAVENWADNCGLTEAELIEEVEERRAKNE